MSDPQIAIVRDNDGLLHHSSRYSKFVIDGLADGSLVEVDEQGKEVVTGAPPVLSGDGVDPDAAKQRSGSGDRKSKADPTGADPDAGAA